MASRSRKRGKILHSDAPPNVSFTSKRTTVNYARDAKEDSFQSQSPPYLNKRDSLQCHKPVPFHIRWINGYNQSVGVINLNTHGSTKVFYSASNCGVIYNWTTKTMKILQGHRHRITCIDVDQDGRWLVTADTGTENVIIIWDKIDLFPQRTIFSPHGLNKLLKVTISADAKYLLTAATTGGGASVELKWWIWANSVDAHATYEMVLPRKTITGMGFNPHRSEQFLLMTRDDLWIGMSQKIIVIERGVEKVSDNYELKLIRLGKELSAEYGRLLCYTFVKGTSQILIATSRGAILVYGYKMEYQTNVTSADMRGLRFIKALKLEKRRINVIKWMDGVIVTGNTAGDLHFYDEQLKLVYWVQGLVDATLNISFNISPRSYQILDPECNQLCICWEKVVAEKDPSSGQIKQKLMLSRIPADCTVAGKPFLVRDFLVCTKEQGVGFVDFVTEKYTTILDFRNTAALTISVHPEKSLLCIGYANGSIELINCEQHKLFIRLDLRSHYKTVIPPKEDSINCDDDVNMPQLSVTCLKYSPSGAHLACGLNTGQLLFLDPTTIEIVTPKPFEDGSSTIEHIDYSPDSLILAFADGKRTVCVYKYDCKTLHWYFVGKHRAHYNDIQAILFLPKKNSSGDYKLISLGLDRHMVEYDIGSSSKGHLEILSLDRMEQTALPLNAIVWPSPKNLNSHTNRTDLPTILVATDEHKYKIVNYETTMTLATILGPRYNHTVKLMQLVTVKHQGEDLNYLLFAAQEVIGMQKLPLDGNPWKHVGQVGHPNKVLQMCVREDLEIMFTIGSKDTVMIQWAADFRSVEQTTKQGGQHLDPYYCLVDDGRPGWLFQEIRDLFYYIQILCQGTFSPAMRRVKDTIPIDSLPDLMRALGFFPSEFAVENLITEAKYKVYLRDPVEEIDLEEFVKLYLNHRPAFGENFKTLLLAFRNSEYYNREIDAISREDFVRFLTENGERFSNELCWYLLSILCGHSFDERAAMSEEDFSFLPEVINFNTLVTEIIGIPDVENDSDSQSFNTLQSFHSASTGESE